MPFTFEHLLIYAIVLLTLAYLLRRWWRCVGKRGQSCGNDCACGNNPVKRNPLIEKLIRRR